MNLFLISNMYPNVNHFTYGVFVKNFELNLLKEDTISLACKSYIRGRGKTKFEKIIKYLYFYCSIFYNMVFKKYDLIYIHYPTYSLPLVAILNKFRQKKIVINYHGDDLLVNSIIQKFMFKLSSLCINDVDLIIVPSRYFKSIVIQKLNIAEEKIFISYSAGINLNIFNSSNNINQNVLEKKKQFVLGYVSRIDNGKGWNLFVELIYKMHLKGYNVKGIMIGDGQEKAHLLQLIKQYELVQEIDFLGEISHQNLPGFYSQMDVFIFPTCLNESLGLVGVEAMACGVPVIGSNIGGIQEYLVDGKNGFLFERSNIESLFEKVEKFYCTVNQEKENLKKCAINTALEFDEHLVSKKLKEKLYDI